MAKKTFTKPTALLMTGVLVTSSFVGGTLARYITTTMSEDSARVAVWGINADEVEMNLFASEYDANGNKVAKSWNGAKIIAPGTSMSSLFSIVNLDGTLAPEVMYEIKVSVDDTEIDQDILDNPFIQWKLDDNVYGSWEDCKADILALSGDASGVKTYAPLEIAEEFADGKTHTIYWRWMLDDNNVQDTRMGNDAVDRDIEAKISVKVTARQVQEDTTGILNGTDQTFNLTNPSALSFRSAAPLTELERVEVDGVAIADTNYTATEGSTVITLKEDYLTTLPAGNHTLSIVSSNSTASVSFKVVEGLATVHNISYSNLQDAINAAEGSKVTLLTDVVLDSAIDVNCSAVLDLSGHKLTLPDVGYNYAVVIRGDLTIEDSSASKTGEVYVNGPYGIALSTSCTGGLTVNSGKFTSADTNTYLIGAFAGHIEINGGEFSSPYCVVNSFKKYTATVQINDGTFTVTGNGKPEAAPLLGINIDVAGGTFSHPVLEKYCADGYAPAENSNGTYGVTKE